MRSLLLLVSMSAFAQDFVATPATPFIPKARHIVTNESVVGLARAGFDEQFIAELIQSSRTRLDASPLALIELKKQGLSEELIRFLALRERELDQPPKPPAPPPAIGPLATTHIEKHWWGYRWVTVSRASGSPRPTTNSTFSTRASNAFHADITTSPR